MNILHMKYAVEVAKVGSLNKAAETLLIAAPNVSRSIKELEADIGISIFERTTKGMELTPEGEEFINYAKGILNQIDEVESFYKKGSAKKQKFSISVPRACYISEAFAQFSKSLSKEAAEIFYKETNSQRTIRNMLEHDYKLGIIRYAENYDKYFKSMLEEKLESIGKKLTEKVIKSLMDEYEIFDTNPEEMYFKIGSGLISLDGLGESLTLLGECLPVELTLDHPGCNVRCGLGAVNTEDLTEAALLRLVASKTNDDAVCATCCIERVNGICEEYLVKNLNTECTVIVSCYS